MQNLHQFVSRSSGPASKKMCKSLCDKCLNCITASDSRAWGEAFNAEERNQILQCALMQIQKESK